MFSFFRRGITSKIMLGVLALGLFAIVATGFGTDGMGVGGLAASGDTVASVEGEPISSAELIDQANRQLETARQAQPELDMAGFLKGGMLEDILSQMIASRALVAFGREQGLAASKKMIDAEIAAVPAFRNLAGQFDPNAFRAALARERVTEQVLREDLAGSLIHRQILLPAAGSPKVPQGMALQYASLLLEQRTGAVGLVPARAMGPGTPPTDAEVAAYYRDNQARYTIPERRVLRYATIGAEQVAQAAQPSEAEVNAFYQRSAARYGPKETRTLSQVVLPDQAAARAFAAKLAAGTSFAQAASEAGFSVEDIRVGEQSKSAFTNLTSAAIADAAFAAAEGATIGPTQSPLGWHIVRVDGIARQPATPLAAVRGEIERQIGQQKQSAALSALVARIEDAIGEGSTLDEVARAEKLNVRETPPITAAGVQVENPGWRAPEITPLLKTAFDMSPDDDPIVETLQADQRFAVVAVSRVVPAAAPPLARIAARVRADLIARRAADRARAVATAIVAKINAGTTARQAFAEARLPLPPVESVTVRRIEIARPDQPVPPPLLMLFSLPQGKARILRAPGGEGWFVVHHEKQVPGNAATSPGLVEATRTQFERVLGEEYADQFGRAVEAGMDVERKPDGIRTVRRQLLGPGAQ
ncbi:MAG TPA: peptidyl-prolyl cis-trans isomerase [Allosphingosinicella sp.]|nr:peptidyl-prolyl cis-trans isomerase [Allosphingosinicella sp.]